MREMVIVPWCDGEHGYQVEAAHEHTIGINEATPVTIDLCEECEAAITELTDLLRSGTAVDRAGAAVAPAKQKRPRTLLPEGESRPCPLCGIKSTSETGLRQHFSTKHRADVGMTLVQWEARQLERMTS